MKRYRHFALDGKMNYEYYEAKDFDALRERAVENALSIINSHLNDFENYGNETMEQLSQRIVAAIFGGSDA